MPNYSDQQLLSSHPEHKEAEGALLKAMLNSANFSSIATDAQGGMPIFRVGAGRMLDYRAAEVVTKSQRPRLPIHRR
jgi:hypothetical protein